MGSLLGFGGAAEGWWGSEVEEVWVFAGLQESG